MTVTPEFIRNAQTWPTIREVATEYGLPEWWVRAQVEKRRVRVIRLTTLRVDPDDWQRFLRDAVTDPEVEAPTGSMRDREPVFTVLAPGQDAPMTPGASIPKPPVESLDPA